MRLAFVRPTECVPKRLASNPILATHLSTKPAYGRVLNLQLRADRPNVFRIKWGLRSDQLAFIPGDVFVIDRDRTLMLFHDDTPQLLRMCCAIVREHQVVLSYWSCDETTRFYHVC
jgi:hypothetical protein